MDFDKETLSRSAIDILQNGLRDDPEQTVSKLSFGECLLAISHGKKLQNAPANYLLLGLLKMLCIEGSPPEDEFQPGELPEDKDLGIYPTLSQSQAESNSQDSDGTEHGSPTGATGSGQGSKSDKEVIPDKYDNSDKSKKSDKNDPAKTKTKNENCRFYLNGKCKFNVDCRFQHPKICPKFRQNGDCKNKGCSGDCGFLHPNVCRNSLKDKTCPYQDCRFFHLKGTKTVERVFKPNNANNPNWRTSNQNPKRGPAGPGACVQQREPNKTRTQASPKNWQTGLNQRTKKKKQSQKQNPGQNQEALGETVAQEEKKQLGQTLEAILKRLDVMESRPTFYQHPGVLMQPQVQPLMSPAVPMPGTQTQYQWGSQPHWTQTPSQ